MPKQAKNIEVLKENPHTLEEKGWHLVTFFKAHHVFACSVAHQKAIEAASEQTQQVGIRSFAYNDVTYYEVWSREEHSSLTYPATKTIGLELTI